MPNDLMKKIDLWYDEEQHQKIVDAILALSEDERDDELLGQLAVAYNNLDQYDDAIAVLNQLRPRQENTSKWQYRMGYALYYVDREEEARDCFARSIELEPDGSNADDCRDFVEAIATPKKERASLELYGKEEFDAISEHIENYFGDSPSVMHEILSPDIHVDVFLVPPTKERNYHTLVTMGMGAHCMNVPEELADRKLERAELLITLEPNWQVTENGENWYWPIRLLKQLARLPGECDTWLSWGHTVDNQKTFAENTQLCGSILVSPIMDEDAEVCELPNGDEVNFYQVIPLYAEEMAYKLENGAEALFQKMGELPFVVKSDRPNLCKEKE